MRVYAAKSFARRSRLSNLMSAGRRYSRPTPPWADSPPLLRKEICRSPFADSLAGFTDLSTLRAIHLEVIADHSREIVTVVCVDSREPPPYIYWDENRR